MNRMYRIAVLGAVAMLSVSACSGSAPVGPSRTPDVPTTPPVITSRPSENPGKAGGVGSPLFLHMGTTYPRGSSDTQLIEHFVDQVKQLSGGSILVEVDWEAAINEADMEPGTIAMVRDHRLALGWIGSRVWDTQGVLSLQAIQAPLLITDDALLLDVLQSPSAAEMLAGLDKAGFVGLGLYPDELVYAGGTRKAFLKLDDFHGAKVRVPTSNALHDIATALGVQATAAFQGSTPAIELDGNWASMSLAPSVALKFMTSNIVLSGRAETLFADAGAFASLSDQQRSIIKDAARKTFEFAITSAPSDVADAAIFCSGGGNVVTASPADVTQIATALGPVMDKMRTDPQTKTFIERIEQLKQQHAAPVLPASCGSPVAVTTPSLALPEGFPQGTFTTVATKQDALRTGWVDACALQSDGAHLKLVLDGTTYRQLESCQGTPESTGDEGSYTATPTELRITSSDGGGGSNRFTWKWDGTVLTLRYVRDSGPNPADENRVLPFLFDHDWTKTN